MLNAICLLSVSYGGVSSLTGTLYLWYPQHAVAIVHIPGRRPFGQNLVNIYIDGELRKTAPLRLPSLNEVTSSYY